jgi:hypothetical protein
LKNKYVSSQTGLISISSPFKLIVLPVGLGTGSPTKAVS